MLIATCVRAIALASCLLASGAIAQEMTAAETFGEWALFTDRNTPSQFCFVTSEPKSSEPQDTQRKPPRAYISAWPKDGVKGEISFRMGFPIKKDGDVKVTINAAAFKLFGAMDRAYVAEPTQELKLVEAMKKGSQMKVTATSDRGPSITDTYSLTGLRQALSKLQSLCF
jgi:invasion protein IalB